MIIILNVRVCENVKALNGLKIFNFILKSVLNNTHLSKVKAVIVRTVAFEDVSAAKPCKIQMASLKGYGYRYHMLYISWGKPFKERQSIAKATTTFVQLSK